MVEEKKLYDDTIEDVQPEAISGSSSPKQLRSKNGVTLFPQPSDDPADPLNWSTPRKLMTLLIITFSGFIGLAQTLAANSGFFIQSRLYGKSPVQISYATSAGITGLAVGPLFWSPVAQRIGRTSCIFWGMLLTATCGTWSAVMTSPGDYNNFVVSRFFSGFFGSVGITLGGGTIIDIFFLHQRGKTFMFYLASLSVGTAISPAISGYIIGHVPWPVQIWWTVGIEGLIAVLTLLFLQETGYPRSKEEKIGLRPQSWFKNRIATFLPGHRVLVQVQGNRPRGQALSPFIIGVCPTVFLTGLILMVDNGWLIAESTLLAVFLQSPVNAGGYGFTPSQNASFNFAQLTGIFCAIAYGFFVSDRIPLWICKRYGGGIWKMEYRLYPALPPAAIGLPVALGLFGASLQYHLPIVLLGFASFLINMSVNALTGVVTNYAVECFTGFAAETTTILSFYRLVLGVTVPFFIVPWRDSIGIGWVFGMMAFLTVLISGVIVLLIWRGPEIRRISFRRYRKSEEGAALVQTEGP